MSILNEIERAIEELPSVEEVLKARPHPHRWEGMTRLDYVVWLIENGGRSGRAQAAQEILIAKLGK